MKGFSKRLERVEEYYFSAKLKEVKSLIAAGEPVIQMGIGSPDLPPHASVVQALQSTAEDPAAHGYQGYQGIPELRTAFSQFYEKHYQVQLSPQEVLPLMGSKEGILHISMAFLDAGDQVLIPNPGYPTYAAVTKLVQAEPLFYNLEEKNGWQPDLEALEKNDLSKVKIMWVNYPNMPTGAFADDDLFEKLVAFGKKHEILIVHDNPYSFILNSKPRSILEIDGAKEVALELNSLSKTFNIPGWRIGMVAGNPDYLKAIIQVKSNMDSGMFLGLQKGAIAALNLGKAWFDELNRRYETRRVLIWKLAEKLNLCYDEHTAGMFVWAKVPQGTDALALTDWLLNEKKIFVAPGFIFGSKGKEYIRFSLCVNEEEILEAIRRVGNTNKLTTEPQRSQS